VPEEGRVEESVCASEVLLHWPDKKPSEFAVSFAATDGALAHISANGRPCGVTRVAGADCSVPHGYADYQVYFSEVPDVAAFEVSILGQHRPESVFCWELVDAWGEARLCHGWITPVAENPFQTPLYTWSARVPS
jgi:hypothetical protein